MPYPNSIAAFLRNWDWLHGAFDMEEIDPVCESDLEPLEEYLRNTAQEEAGRPVREPRAC